MASQSISTFPVFHGAVENFHARLLEVPPLFILTCEQIKFHNLRSNHSSVSVSTEVIRIFMEYFSRIMLHPQNTNSAQVVCLSVSCSLKFMSTVSWLFWQASVFLQSLCFPEESHQRPWCLYLINGLENWVKK